MGKFGKKTVVGSDLSQYMIGIIGGSGLGKTTLMYNVCSKLFGDDGYIILDTGTENGVKAISGVVAERAQNFGKLKEVVDDIVKNKDTDYPNLKVVVIDTLDAYFEIVEEYVIKEWNARNAGQRDFVKALSINSVEGGFGRGLERVIDVAKKVISKLNAVGVGVWWTAHIKEKDQIDMYTGNSYTTLTANMTAKYFNSIKNSTDIVACGYYDRSFEKTEIGKENPVTKKKKERSTVVDESRKVKFRDDMMIADAKSRFSHIIGEITLNADEFIKAIQDAIAYEQDGYVPPVEEETKATPVSQEVEKEEFVDHTAGLFDDDVVAENVAMSDSDKAKIISEIRSSFKELPKETKDEIRSIKGTVELEELDDESLLKIEKIIKQ